jgi:hypothetical protein
MAPRMPGRASGCTHTGGFGPSPTTAIATLSLDHDQATSPRRRRPSRSSATACIGRDRAQRRLAAELGDDPSPSSLITSAGERHTRRRSIVTRRAFASREFCTSSATALRGSLWLRESHRIRSNGSAGRSLRLVEVRRPT